MILTQVSNYQGIAGNEKAVRFPKMAAHTTPGPQSIPSILRGTSLSSTINALNVKPWSVKD